LSISRSAAGPPTIDLIQAIVAEVFGITREELLSDARTQRVTWPRQLAMYLSRKYTAQSLPAIGQAFGGRNHTTVMHAIKKVDGVVGVERVRAG
jgi:chromosomal replication initiator protein